jgi:hypothetical protein
VPADARSGAAFERIVVGPDRYFVKRLSMASDWIMRASGDRVCRQYLSQLARLVHDRPEVITEPLSRTPRSRGSCRKDCAPGGS